MGGAGTRHAQAVPQPPPDSSLGASTSSDDERRENIVPCLAALRLPFIHSSRPPSLSPPLLPLRRKIKTISSGKIAEIP